MMQNIEIERCFKFLQFDHNNSIMKILFVRSREPEKQKGPTPVPLQSIFLFATVAHQVRLTTSQLFLRTLRFITGIYVLVPLIYSETPTPPL